MPQGMTRYFSVMATLSFISNHQNTLQTVIIHTTRVTFTSETACWWTQWPFLYFYGSWQKKALISSRVLSNICFAASTASAQYLCLILTLLTCWRGSNVWFPHSSFTQTTVHVFPATFNAAAAFGRNVGSSGSTNFHRLIWDWVPMHCQNGYLSAING